MLTGDLLVTELMHGEGLPDSLDIMRFEILKSLWL
jgi:hypothetical protein